MNKQADRGWKGTKVVAIWGIDLHLLKRATLLSGHNVENGDSNRIRVRQADFVSDCESVADSSVDFRGKKKIERLIMELTVTIENVGWLDRRKSNTS